MTTSVTVSVFLPTEKAQSLKMQVEAIKHQGSRPGEEDKDAGKRSTQVVGDRNGMNYKQVQRYIRLTELVPDLQKMVDEKRLAFTPAVEISFIRPKNQRYIAVSIEGQQSSPSLSQAQKNAGAGQGRQAQRRCDRRYSVTGEKRR